MICYRTQKPITLSTGTVKIDGSIAKRFGASLKKTAREDEYQILKPIQLKVGIEFRVSESISKALSNYVELLQEEKPADQRGGGRNGIHRKR